MDSSNAIPAILVTSGGSLHSTPPGGVQICTREFIASLNSAGFKLTILEWDTDRRPMTRLRRKLRAHPYADRVPPRVIADVIRAQQSTGARIILLSGVELAEIAKEIRDGLKSPDAKLVLFSYGLKSVDYLHNARVAGNLDSTQTAFALGQLLIAEANQRRYLDHVLCLAPFEVTFEEWLGAKKVDWIPRTVSSLEPPLVWRPTGDRIGCVCTLHHGPNAEGLLQFLMEFDRLAPRNVRFRLVGQPAEEGRQIAQQFRFVDYLGHLDDAALREEAVSWNCFVHPLFCHAAGASTKLATALAWQIPIVTTTVGRRGYVWRKGEIPTAEEPESLAGLTVRMLDLESASATREQIKEVAASCPTLQDVGVSLRRMLLS